MAEVNPEQAMMQGMMGAMGPPAPASPMGGPTPAPEGPPPEPSEGRGTDTALGHLTPGEVIIPIEILQNSGNAQSIQAMFEQAQIPMSVFTVGHADNNINPETGYPEFFLGGWISKGIGFVSGKRAKRKATSAAQAAATRELQIHEKKMKKLRKQIDESLTTAKTESAARKAKAERDFRGQQMVGRRKFQQATSNIRRTEAGAGTSGTIARVAGETKAVPETGARSKSAWRRKSKRRRKYMQRRPT